MFTTSSPTNSSPSYQSAGNFPNSENKKMTERRVLMLSEKISNLKFGHKAESEKKHHIIEKTCDDIEAELQNIKNIFDNHCLDIKQIIGDVQKQLSHDYAGSDHLVKEEIRRCEDKFIQMTENHVCERKKSDNRLNKFVDEKCSILRNLIERESKERLCKGQEIEESLSNDLISIKERLEEEKQVSSSNLEQIHTEFLSEYGQMRKEFEEICEKSSVEEGEFYKMLRDILKKVKEELSGDKIKREEMEETILALIEKICDKAMEEVRV